MYITILDHAHESMDERGTNEQEVKLTVESGEMIPAKVGRVCYVKNFHYDSIWRGHYYTTKQVHAIVALHGGERRVITVITKYFGKGERNAHTS